MRVAGLRDVPDAAHLNVDLDDELRVWRLSESRVGHRAILQVLLVRGRSEQSRVLEQGSLLVLGAEVGVVAEQLHGHAVSRRTVNDGPRVSLVDSLLRGTVRRINDGDGARRRERGVHIAPRASNDRPEPSVKRLPRRKLSQADAVAAVESIPRGAQRAAQAGDLIAQFLRIDQILGAY